MKENRNQQMVVPPRPGKVLPTLLVHVCLGIVAIRVTSYTCFTLIIALGFRRKCFLSLSLF